MYLIKKNLEQSMLNIYIKYFPTEAGEIFSSEHYPLGNDMYLVKKIRKRVTH